MGRLLFSLPARYDVLLVDGTIFVITVYEPDPTLWDATLRTRRRP